jgi:sarcosine oxidase subunit beta
LRRTQLTADLTEYACRASDRWAELDRVMGSRNPLLYPTTYTWVFYREDERAVVEPLQGIWETYGARGRIVPASEVLDANPVLAGGQPPAAGVITDAVIVHHDAAVHGLYLQACALGAEFVVGEPVDGPVDDGDRVAGVVTASGRKLRADVVVNAAGARSPELAAALGVDIPNRPVRREVLVTEPRRPFMRGAVVFYDPQEGWFNQTLRGELVAGVVDVDEPLGMNEGSSLRFLARTARIVLEKAPRLAELRVIRQWAGCYDWTPDKRPLIGFHAARPGIYEMNGWSGRGFLLAPLTAQLAAREITGQGRDRLLAPFAADRFAGTGQAVRATADYYGSYVH